MVQLNLPLEVWSEVITCLSAPEQTVTGRVCKAFKDMSTRCLYRDISLSRGNEIVQCCRTLASNQLAATSVRRFQLGYQEADLIPMPIFYRLVIKALRATTQLRELGLRVDNSEYIEFFSECYFPHLRNFVCEIPWTPSTTPFLIRHSQTLDLLSLAYRRRSFEHLDDLQNYVTFPKLRCLIAPSSLVPLFLLGSSSLIILGTSWQPESDKNDFEIFFRLVAVSGVPLTSVSCIRNGWSIEMLQAIARHLPQLLSLSLYNNWDDEEDEDFVHKVAGALSQFQRLRRLAIERPEAIEMQETGMVSIDLQSSVEHASSWRSGCASLAKCTFPNGVTLAVDSDGSWCVSPHDE